MPPAPARPLLQPPRRRSHWLCCSPPASLPSPAMIRWDNPRVVLGAQPDGCKEHLDFAKVWYLIKINH